MTDQKTANFMEFILAIVSFFVNFVEFIFAMGGFERSQREIIMK